MRCPIHSYAGWLGTVAARHINSDLSQTSAEMMSPAATSHPSAGLLSGQSGPAPSLDESKHRLAAVAGTSTCYIVNAPGSQFGPGVWGPYRDAVFPGWWMNEGGQSATGQLIEFVIMEHHAYPELKRVCEERGEDVYTG
jgi:ribulose kinase